MKKLKEFRFPGSLLMAPAYLALGLFELYIGRKEKNRASNWMGMLWMAMSACWTVFAMRDIWTTQPKEDEPGEDCWED